MKSEILVFMCCFLMSNLLFAQTKPIKDSVELNPIIYSGTKYQEKKQNIVQKIDVISAKQIATANAANTGDLLMQSGNVFVQKSQQAGSSPTIRGFEASRVLIVIDGVRMNNAIFRSGHLQNVISIDQAILQSVEILNGPASTLFGSDALGGVLNFTTKRATFNSSSKILLNTLNGFARYSTAAQEKSVHADFSFANYKFGSLTSITASDFDDLRCGANRKTAWDSLGLRKFYAATFNGVDSIVTNNNWQKQIGSAYGQLDLLQKFNYKANEKVEHLLNIQMSTSTDNPRFDRLTDTKAGKLSNASWYYGPQKRKLIGYATELRSMSGLSKFGRK
jgi:hemoglobin/transferrin/lactoferrin receptor protein